MKEQWKAVPDWEGWYSVSSEGRVRSEPRWLVKKDRFGHDQKQFHKGRVLKVNILKSGYGAVSLTAPGYKRYYAYVHQLVLLAFEGSAPEGHEVRHLNGVRADSRLSNLTYGTRSENALDRHAHGTMLTSNPATRGEKNTKAKLTLRQVKQIRANPKKLTLKAWGEKFGVSLHAIWCVIHRTSWNWVKE